GAGADRGVAEVGGGAGALGVDRRAQRRGRAGDDGGGVGDDHRRGSRDEGREVPEGGALGGLGDGAIIIGGAGGEAGDRLGEWQGARARAERRGAGGGAERVAAAPWIDGAVAEPAVGGVALGVGGAAQVDGDGVGDGRRIGRDQRRAGRRGERQDRA